MKSGQEKGILGIEQVTERVSLRRTAARHCGTWLFPDGFWQIGSCGWQGKVSNMTRRVVAATSYKSRKEGRKKEPSLWLGVGGQWG